MVEIVDTKTTNFLFLLWAEGQGRGNFPLRGIKSWSGMIAAAWRRSIETKKDQTCCLGLIIIRNGTVIRRKLAW